MPQTVKQPPTAQAAHDTAPAPAAASSPSVTPAESPAPPADRLLSTIDSLGTASASGSLVTSSQAPEAKSGGQEPQGSKLRGPRRTGSGRLSGGGLARIVRLLSSSKSQTSNAPPAGIGANGPAGAATAPPGRPQPSIAGSVGSAAESCSSATTQQQQQQQQQQQREGSVSGAGGPGSRVLHGWSQRHSVGQQSQPQPQPGQQCERSSSSRWWAAGCLGPPRLHEGAEDQQQRSQQRQHHDIAAMFDTTGSVSRPSDLLISTVTDAGPGAAAGPAAGRGPGDGGHVSAKALAAAAGQEQPPFLAQGQQPSQQQGQVHSGRVASGDGGAERSGSFDSSGQMDLERLVRLRKSSGRNLRVSLERTLQNKVTRNGSGPGGALTAGGGAGSGLISTHDSKPRESFESDWDVMGADTDGNALSAMGMATTTTAFDGNSGGINAQSGPGGRAPGAVLAAAGALSNGDSGSVADAAGGGASGRHYAKRRQGGGPPSRASRDMQDPTAVATATTNTTTTTSGATVDSRDRHLYPHGHADSPGRPSGREPDSDRDRDRGSVVMRSPTSSSNMPVDLSFNPDARNPGAQALVAKAAALGTKAAAARDPHRGGAAGGGGATGSDGGAASGAFDSDHNTNANAGDATTAKAGRPPTPEDLLAAQMMALQNRINALTDEDLLNPSAKLGFVSPPPAAPPPPPPHPSTQLTLMQFTSASSSPYIMTPIGSDVGLGPVVARGSLHGSALVAPPAGGHPGMPYHAHHQGLGAHPHYPHHPSAAGAGGANPHGLQLQPHPVHGLASPPMGGMGALYAMSAFLGSPSSRAASMYDGGALLMTTAATSSAAGTAATRAGAGSPGSAGGGAAAARAAAAPGGIRSMQSNNEDGFLSANMHAGGGGGGSSHRLASSHLGGMGGATSNSSVQSMRPGGPGSDDPGAILSTRDDTGLLGPLSRGHPAMMMRSSDIDVGPPGTCGAQDGSRGVAGGMAPGMLFSTRDSSIGDRLLHAKAFDPAAAAGATGAPAAGTGGAGSPPARPSLSPIKAPSGGAGGGPRFTLAAALSRFQEELQQSIVAPAPGAAGVPAGAVGGSAAAAAGAGTTPAGAGSRVRPSLSSTGAATDGAAAAGAGAPGGAWSFGPAGGAAATAAALGRGGMVAAGGGGGGGRDLVLGSDRGVVREYSSSNGTAAGMAVHRNTSLHQHQQQYPQHQHAQHPHPHPQHTLPVPESPDLVAQQLLNSSAAVPPQPFLPSSAQSMPQHPSTHQMQQMQQPYPTPGSRRRSTEYLYDEFFSNMPLFNDPGGGAAGMPQPGAGGGAGGGVSGLIMSHSNSAEGGDPLAAHGSAARAAAGAGQAASTAAGLMPGAMMGPGPPPIHSRSVHRNISAESLRIQAAHRSMEGRAAAAAAGMGVGAAAGSGPGPLHMQWSGTPPSPLSSGSGRPPSPQGAQPPQPPPRQATPHAPGGNQSNRQTSSERLNLSNEPTLGHVTVDAAVAAAAAGGMTVPAAPAAAVLTLSTSGAPPPPPGRTIRAHSGTAGGVLVATSSLNSGSAMGSSNGTAPLSDAPLLGTASLPPPPSLSPPPLGAGGRLFAEGSSNARSESVAPPPAGASPTEPAYHKAGGGVSAAAAAAAAGSGYAVVDSGATLGVGGRTSTDAVVAGLLESVLRSGAAAALLEDAGASAASVAAVSSTGTEDSVAAAAAGTAAAHGLAILPPASIPAAGGRSAAGSTGRVPSGASAASQQQSRGRPGSGGTAGAVAASVSGSGVATATPAGPLGSATGAAAAAAPNRSLEALMAFCDESGQPLLHFPLSAEVPARATQHHQHHPQHQQHHPQQEQEQRLSYLQPHHQNPQSSLQGRPLPPLDSASVQTVGLGPSLGGVGVVPVVPRPQYGTGEVLLLAAGGLVLLFNMVIIIYVLVTMHLLMYHPGVATGAGGGGGAPGGREL